MTVHRCHALGCDVACKPEHLMCAAHWAMVPVRAQRRVYATYRRGQCDDKRPSHAWMIAANWAIVDVGRKERRDVSAILHQIETLCTPAVHLCVGKEGACGEYGCFGRPREPGNPRSVTDWYCAGCRPSPSSAERDGSACAREPSRTHDLRPWPEQRRLL